MKKISAILAALVILTFAGCASSGGGGGGGAASGESLSVDLSTLKEVKVTADKVGDPTGQTVKNADPFTKNYDDLMLLFNDLPDVTKFQRLTVKAKYFKEDGGELGQADGMAMVSLIYDLNGDLRGPEMGPGGNVAVKEFNVGGFSGAISSDRGIRVNFK
jgi:hypothetical protein